MNKRKAPCPPRTAGPPSLEPLEPRLHLSAADYLTVLSEIPSSPAADASEQFAWDGFSSVKGSQVTTLRLRFDHTPIAEATPQGTAVRWTGLDQAVEPGRPMLPHRQVKLLLPPTGRITRVAVHRIENRLLAGYDRLATVPSALPYGVFQPSSPPGGPAPSAPTRGWGAVSFETQTLLGYQLGLIDLQAVAYDPLAGEIRWSPRVDLEVTVETDSVPGQVPIRRSGDDLLRVAGEVDNDSAAIDYLGLAAAADDPGQTKSASAPPPAEYLVVTSPELADAFQPLVDSKIALGLSADLVTTDEVAAAAPSPFEGEDDPAGRLRQYLTDAYTQRQTRWVLLAGDIDQVPHRQVYVSANGYGRTFETNMYFACLDGPYNRDGDEHWGEYWDGVPGGDVDRTPELIVGRAPVSTPAEAQAFVAKTLAHQAGGSDHPRRALWLGEKMQENPLTWGGDYMDGIRGEVFPDGFEHTRLYQRDQTFSRQGVIDAMNASPALVNHLGHSTFDVSAELSRSDVDALANESPFFLYSEGCYAGQFERSDAIAEHFLTASNAAWGAVMNTHFGWYVPGELGGSYDWHVAFYRAVFELGLGRVGEAHVYSKTSLPSSSGTGRWTFFASTLFADPHLELAPAHEVQRVWPKSSHVRLADDHSLLVLEARTQGASDLVWSWTVDQRPPGGLAEVEDPGQPDTVVDFDGEGVYVLTGSAWSPYRTVSTTVTVTVGGEDVKSNVAPTVDAGSDQVLSGQQTLLEASIFDDGWPVDQPLNVQWEQVGQSPQAEIADPTSAKTLLTMPTEGRYALRLLVDDGEVRTADDVHIARTGPGDANGDGTVDIGDLGILSWNFGKTVAEGDWSQGDLTGDGLVNVGDLGILAHQWGGRYFP